MRSPQEVLFRLRQEAANLWLLNKPPDWAEPVSGPLPSLPDPVQAAATLAGSSAYTTEVERIASDALQHRFHLLGLEPVTFESRIPWRKDWVHQKETGTGYFRRIPYLDFHQAGDHKIIWELNRHQHLVTLAQAFLLTGRRGFLDEIPQQLEDWMAENPVQRGINWSSALEVAFRTLSWLWVLHLVGEHFEAAFRRRWMRSLYHHGVHLEYNLSVYFSPNTHLLGEAVALHALGRLVPGMPRAERWRELGNRIVFEQMRRQVRDDGSHFEQSSYYHLYAVDLFLLHTLLAGDVPAWYREKLTRMVEFLDALVSSEGILPLIGDEDGGRLFHPYGDCRLFAQATLATSARLLERPAWMRNPAAAAEQAAWWLPPGPVPESIAAPESRWFPDAGVAVMRSDAIHLIVDAGPFGGGSAGHSHADTLSIVAFHQGREALIDPGTFTYVADAEARQRYRGTASHNTVSIDSLEQAEPRGPFRWAQPPEAGLLAWHSDARADILDVCCRYRGFTHRRSIVFQKSGWLIVLDRVSGPGSHRLEQRWLAPSSWHLERFLVCLPGAAAEPAKRSPAFGSEEPARRWIARYHGPLPAYLAAIVGFDNPPRLESVEPSASGIQLTHGGGIVRFPEHGPPEVIS